MNFFKTIKKIIIDSQGDGDIMAFLIERYVAEWGHEQQIKRTWFFLIVAFIDDMSQVVTFSKKMLSATWKRQAITLSWRKNMCEHTAKKWNELLPMVDYLSNLAGEQEHTGNRTRNATPTGYVVINYKNGSIMTKRI